jgi:hypothetical protein
MSRAARARAWTDKDGQERYTTEIRGDEMKMLGSRQGMGAPAGGGGGFDDEPTDYAPAPPKNKPKPSFDDLGRRYTVLSLAGAGAVVFAAHLHPNYSCKGPHGQCRHLQVLEDIARDLSGNEITFPTFLDITFQVRAALKDPNLSVDQLAKLVGAEPLMSAKIIRMANSVALNPSGREIADVKSAIVRVGMEAVRTVSFAVAMEQLLKSKQMQPFEGISQRLWEHTSHVAALCRVLARKLAKINGDEAMLPVWCMTSASST